MVCAIQITPIFIDVSISRLYIPLKDNSFEFKFNNKTLDIVQEYKYLGVVINSVKTLKGDIFKNMKIHIADKARKACFATLKKYYPLCLLATFSTLTCPQY